MNGVEDNSHGVRKYFYFIKEEVSSDWKDLAYQLGVKQADINNIAGKKQDDKSCCMDLLCEWLESNGARATIEVLMEALSEVKLQSIVDGLKTKYPELTAQRQPVGANQAQTESMKAPEGLKALETTNDSVKLGWTKVNSNQTSGYRLEQSIAFEENWVSAQGDRKLLPATITEFTVVDLTPYKEYHFCVRSAIDRMGKLVLSERSVPLYVVAKQPYQPYRPRNVKLTDCTHASLSLTWKEPSPADDVNPSCYEYVVEMCAHGNDQGVKRWTEYCRTTQCHCPINEQDNGIYRFRVSANNTENDVTSLPEEMGDPVIPIHVKTKSEWLMEVLKTFWPFPATTQPRSQESGSIIFNISCHDLEGLRELWMNYKLGKVKKFFGNFFARLARLSSVQTDTELEIRIDKEDFYSCRRHLLLTRPTSKGFRVVRLGEGDSRGTRLGLSEDYPVYCKPITHKTTCSQLDFLDPAIPVDQQGLDRAMAADNLSVLPHLSRPVHCSSLPGLDLAVVKEEQSRKQGNREICHLRAAVRVSREKSQRLEVQLNAVREQLQTERQETKALGKGITKLAEEKENAQKIILEHKMEIQQLQETNKKWEETIEGMEKARQQTEALMLNLSKEVTRLTEEKEKAQQILQEQKIEIQQLQENNKSMAATIEELMDAKHTAKGESGGEDHGRKGDPGSEKGRTGEQEKGTYTGETGPWKKEESAFTMASAQRNSSPGKFGLSPRSKLYSKINKQLSEEQVKSLRAMLITDHHIAKGRIENATPHEIFTMLEADNKIGEGNLRLLKDLLIALNEGQLAKEVEDLERGQLADISKLHSELGFKVEDLKPKGGGIIVRSSSIPLILPNDLKYNASTGRVEKVHGVRRESLQVVPEALDLLEGIEEPVSVLAITGPCRTGKSYILSRLLGTADAFELGHSMDPQTFGIWMGTKVLRGKDFTIVLLDTEGIDAVGGIAGQDASILVLTTLLSSRLIYNSLYVPHKGDLDKMQCFIKLATGITVKQGEASDVPAFQEFFPDFLWLLRDVSLKMEDESGKEMDPTEYIKKVLSRNPNASEESTSDKVGRAILTFFPSAECAILERPSDKKEVMNNIAQHTDGLNPEFNKGVHDLVVRLLLKARAKRGYHRGSTVSGEALSIMAKQYVDAVNDPNSIPALDNTWQNTIELMRDRAIEEAVMEYNRQMQAQIPEARITKNGEPLEEDASNIPMQPTIMGLHNVSVKTVTTMLLKKVGHFNISTENQGTGEINAVVDQMQKRLVQQEEHAVDGTRGLVVTGGELFHYIQQNREHSKNFCKGLYEHLLDPIWKHVESPPPDFDFDKLTRGLAAARQQYEKQARGPEKWVVQQEMIKDMEKIQVKIEKMGYQRSLMQEQQKAHEAELLAKEREGEFLNQLTHVQYKLQTQQETFQEIIQQYEKQIKQMKQDMEERHAVALQRIEDLKNAKRAEQAEIARDLLEKERAVTREKIKKMENEQADLYRQLEGIRSAKESNSTS